MRRPSRPSSLAVDFARGVEPAAAAGNLLVASFAEDPAKLDNALRAASGHLGVEAML